MPKMSSVEKAVKIAFTAPLPDHAKFVKKLLNECHKGYHVEIQRDSVEDLELVTLVYYAAIYNAALTDVMR